MNGSVKELNMFYNYETEKITRKASDAAEYIQLFGSSAQDRHAWRINVILWTSADICVVDDDSSCMTISGESTEQHVVIGFGELVAVD